MPFIDTSDAWQRHVIHVTMVTSLYYSKLGVILGMGLLGGGGRERKREGER